MDVVPESEDSPEGDDDKVYMFFSENAVEYDLQQACGVACRQSLQGNTSLVPLNGANFCIFCPDLVKTFVIFPF